MSWLRAQSRIESSLAPHDVKGQGVFAYVILAEGVADTPDLVPSLKMSVRNEIGGLAIPDGIAIVSGLPKTRASL